MLCPDADGTPLESSSRLLISSTLKNFQLLTILVVNADDLGVYTCSVRNTLGTAATTAVLRKAGGCTVPGPLGGDRERGHPTCHCLLLEVSSRPTEAGEGMRLFWGAWRPLITLKVGLCRAPLLEAYRM